MLKNLQHDRRDIIEENDKGPQLEEWGPYDSGRMPDVIDPCEDGAV